MIKWYKLYISSFKYVENDYITTTISLSTNYIKLSNNLHKVTYEPVVSLCSTIYDLQGQKVRIIRQLTQHFQLKSKDVNPQNI